MAKKILILTLSFSFLFAYSCLFADEKLVAYYNFENGFTDSSGNNLHGLPSGNAAIVYDSDRESKVLLLDGYNDYVDLGNNALFNWSGAFSVAFWVNVKEWQNNWDTIIKKADSWSFERHIDQQALAFYHWPNFVPTTVPLPDDGTWHHIAATYDGQVQKIYKDGMMIGTATNIGEINVNSNHVFIGAAEGRSRNFKGRIDDVLFYNRILTESEIGVLGDVDIPFSGELSHVTKLEGNYELNAKLMDGENSTPVRIFFSANEAISLYAFIEISGDNFRIGREMAGATDIWKTIDGIGDPPWEIKILKKGNFFRFWVNDATGWIRGPLGEWQRIYEPFEAFVGVISFDSSAVQEFQVTTLTWLQQITQPVIPKGPPGSYYEQQIIPGAIVEFESQYYMYFMAGKFGTQEGAAERTIGVAYSSDLYNWTVEPEPVLSYEVLGELGDNIYPNGATITPEGKIALMYAVQKFPEWKGFFLATADHPLGPFENYSGNPVYKHFTHAHEFDLVRVKDQNPYYILFYSGFTPEPPTGPDGDRGYVLYSDNLINWTEDPQNPVLAPETLDNWDAVHIRPRSLNKIGNMYYLWYEGCNHWIPPNTSHHGWWDTIGLARSEDLYNWEYYPRNPALPATGISANQFDSNWVGWPRMVIKNDTGYVFYTGNGETGMRTIALDQLTDWESEGGIVLSVKENLAAEETENSNTVEDFILYQNYPNPFNPHTFISFYLKKVNEVTLTIYNAIGQEIYIVKNNFPQPGSYGFQWNGIDQHGNRVGSGLYFYELKTENYRALRKLILVR